MTRPRWLLPCVLGISLAMAVELTSGVRAVSGQAAESDRFAFVVHMPTGPFPSPQELDRAASSLAAYVAQYVPRLDLDVRVFRHWPDAAKFLQTGQPRTLLLLVDSPFVLDLPAASELTPMYRLASGDAETQRFVMVARSDNEAVTSIADLKGKNVSMVESAGSQFSSFLRQTIFAAMIDPATFFGAITATADDQAALYGVLLSRFDAALVSEENPVFGGEEKDKLKVVFATEPLSRPVIALQQGLLSEVRLVALDRALLRIDERDEGKQAMQAFASTRIVRVVKGEGPMERSSLATLPSPEKKVMEVDFGGVSSAPDNTLDAPSQVVPILVEVPLPDLPEPEEED
ncbi:MAG: PhnD/SsuA/transferrin family substrate-binding protein [Candidatus Schekmanbacteria bacterium]|nr:PhnD/SsuA/transferrin family substrate-binding protein [Candidatus Schekmanbacteria bacterium]